MKIFNNFDDWVKYFNPKRKEYLQTKKDIYKDLNLDINDPSILISNHKLSSITGAIKFIIPIK